MPTENDTTPPEVDDNTPVPQLREAYNRAAERARAHEEAAGRVPNLERENAMLRAGVDLESPLGQVFSRGYDGELESSAIREAYQAIAPTGAPPPPPTSQETTPPAPQADQDAIERQRRLEALNSGSTPPGQEPTAHPWDEAQGIYTGNRKRNMQRDRAAAPAFDHVLEAAVAGDTRVIYDPRKPYSEQFDPR